MYSQQAGIAYDAGEPAKGFQRSDIGCLQPQPPGIVSSSLVIPLASQILITTSRTALISWTETPS